MKIHQLLFLLFAFSSFQAVSQTLVKDLKKKNYGVYRGEIPGYTYLSDTTTVVVDKTPVEIRITDKSVDMTIGRLNKKGSYHLLFKGKDYYVIDAFFEGDLLTERIILNEKKKTILREGNFPQPNATLNKVKGK